MSTARLEAFSDAVFAIAITLLVLEIKVPAHGEPDGLAEALAHQWPSYAAYVVSFLTIGIAWVNHHTLFDHVRRTDRSLLFLNLGLLMWVAFIPFPTALLVEYVGEAGRDSHVAAAVYGATMTVLGINFSVLWTHLIRRSLLDESFPSDRARRWHRRAWRGPLAYAASVVVALFSSIAALVMFALVALAFALPARR